LHSCLAALPPEEVIRMIESQGVLTKTEPGGKIFPVSDRATDVLRALLDIMRASGAELAFNEPLVSLERANKGFQLTTAKRVLLASRVILTTGGQSYPGSGTTGDGYGWLRVDERRGSFLFTHFGMSGPVALDASRVISRHADPKSLQVVCDFLPDTNSEALDAELRDAIAAAGKKQIAQPLVQLVPRRLAESLLTELNIDAGLRAAELPKSTRRDLVQLIKGWPVPVSGTRGFKKAEVTAGGVSLDEVDSRTMASRLVPGLFIAGELLDVDGPIGGYNFQAAFSTGWLAGQSG